MSDKKSSGFGGIFKKLGDLAIKPEYLEQEENQPEEKVADQVAQTPVQQPQSTKTVFATANMVQFTATSASPTQEDIKATVEKIYNYLESINKPGVDFLEFWNAVEAMDGGIIPANIKNAFVAIKMMSGNVITKDVLISTGNAYVIELTNAITQDITKKQDAKNNLNNALNQEKNQLETEVLSLETQIQNLQTALANKKQALSEINVKYAPKMQEADKAITCGTTALKLVVDEINQFVALIGSVIQ